MLQTRLAPFAAALLLTATGAHAQSSSHNPAVKNSSAKPTSQPAHGANSFTEDQAKGRLAKAGYTNISNLKKDQAGVWRGTATKSGKSGPVGLDYKGNVVTH